MAQPWQGLQQVQKQSQQQILAPQLRQSLKILQVPALDLQTTIREEIQNNPLLEELPLVSENLEESVAPVEAGDGTGEDLGDNGEFDSDFALLHELAEDARDPYYNRSARGPHTAEDAERRQHLFDSLVSETSLQEHLMEQAVLADCTEDDLEAMRYLIGSLDDRGFLNSSLQDLAAYSNIPLDRLQRASELLKNFDPPGIGCQNLQECLLHQLKLRGDEHTLAATVIRDHFDLLMRRRIPEISRKVSAGVETVQDAIQEIATLDPAPARRFSEDTNRTVAPDVIVHPDGDDFVVEMNNDYIPQVRISNTYKNLIASGNLTRQEKEYIREKLRNGKFLISSIEQRQQTIERIAREIVTVQKDFFREGVSRLKPLTMTEIAKAVGVHETTVSRAIANKYVKTPHGTFEFKYFFTPGYKADDGSEVSNKSIKEIIAHLIEEESPRKPLSDQEISNILKKRNINVARRTVAKYRESIGILPAKLRRRF
jgi:RNA polymerase sigma-54 factor